MKTYLNKNILSSVAGAALISSAMCLSGAGAASGQTSIGVLDVNRIITEAKASKDINKQMEAFRTGYQATVMKQEKTLRASEKQLTASQKSLSPKDFEKKKKEFEAQVVELQKAIMTQNNELQKSAQFAMEKIRTHVVEISKDIAGKRGFAFILPSNVPIYYEQQFDITDLIIKQLDQKLPKMKIDIKTTVISTSASNKKATAAS